MNNYPSLSEMGIKKIEDIHHYTLRQDGKDRDLLKIFYKREKGSFLPGRKVFKFGRSVKAERSLSNPNQSTEVYEISPFVLKAVKELDSIINKKTTETDKLKLLLQRIEELEAEMHSATNDLKDILKSMS